MLYTDAHIHMYRPKAFGLFTAANMLSNLVASSLVMSIVNSLGGSRRSALVMLAVLSGLSAVTIAFVHNSIKEHPSCTYLDNLHHQKLVKIAHKKMHRGHHALATDDDDSTATTVDATTAAAADDFKESITVVRAPATGSVSLQQFEVGASHSDDASSVYSSSGSDSSSVADSRLDVEMAQLCAVPCASASSSSVVVAEA
jgi:hypothetical protein